MQIRFFEYSYFFLKEKVSKGTSIRSQPPASDFSPGNKGKVFAETQYQGLSALYGARHNAVNNIPLAE